MADSVLMSCEIKQLGPVDAIIKLLECPICQGVPIPPIWNCTSGHSVCDQCRGQLQSCGLCRSPFSGGRNFFMEGILLDCKLSCPYAEAGCDVVAKGDHMKVHAADCKFGPKIKWIACQHGQFPENAVEGGMQNGVKLYVMRAGHQGSHTPGKLYEYSPPGSDPDISCASLAWGGGERVKYAYEVLVAYSGYVKWIPSSLGAVVPNAVRGGTSEHGEILYIGRFMYGDEMINGKIHPSHQCCYIGVDGIEKASQTYEILVECPNTERDKNEENKESNSHGGGRAAGGSDMPHYYS